MTWGEQTDVPESADWYNSSYIIAWGSNVPQTRTPDAHFFTEVRYKGTKTIAITPDYSEVAKLCDQWLAPKQGTDSALAMAMGHVILKAFHLDNPSDYFLNYCRTYTDMPMLVILEPRDDGSYTPGRMLRASDLLDGLGKVITRNGKPWPITATANWWRRTAPSAFAGAKKANGISNNGQTAKMSSLSCRCWIFATAWCRWASLLWRQRKPAFSQRSAVTGDPSPATG